MPVEISLFDPSSASDADMAEHYDVTIAVGNEDYPGEQRSTLDEYARMLAAHGEIDRARARFEEALSALAPSSPSNGQPFHH